VLDVEYTGLVYVVAGERDLTRGATDAVNFFGAVIFFDVSNGLAMEKIFPLQPASIFFFFP